MTTPEPLAVAMLSYHVTEESGGPGIAAAGFAASLASRGARVRLIALDGPGHWLVDPAKAAQAGYELLRISGWFPAHRLPKMLAAARDFTRGRRGVIWVNGIWGAQSLAGWAASKVSGWPLVVRPAGSLGTTALQYKRVKKALYYRAIESRVIEHARAIHCMTEKERDELPGAVRERAFIVPSGVDAPSSVPAARERNLIGVLARIHPIKNHHAVLDAVESLVSQGMDLQVEFAGTVSDRAYADELRAKIERSSLLRGRVRLLGHVEKGDLGKVVGRWSVAVLLSEQENFGHAVIAAASVGTPTVVSGGVGLGRELESAGAGMVTTIEGAQTALRLLIEDMGRARADACVAFAARYGWDACAKTLMEKLTGL
jgi:glycosyltransferase involved in cell wall biosynthesis